MDNYPFLKEATINVIKELRKNSGISQQKLAEKSSVDRLYILHLESGKFRPTLNSVFFIADGLGLRPEELVRLVAMERERLEQLPPEK